MKPNKTLTLDFLASDIKLLMQGKPSVNTTVGVVLSVVCMSIFVTLTYMIVSTYFDTSKPKITQELISMKNKPVIDFEHDKHFPIFLFYYKDTIYLEKEELQKFVHVTLGRYTYYAQPDGSETVQKQFYDLVPCSELQNSNPGTFHVDGDPAKRESLLKAGYCIDSRGEQVTLGSDDENIAYQIVTIDIWPCTLSSGCKPKEDLKDLTFSIANPTVQTNYGDYKKPIKFRTEPEEYEYLSLELNQRNRFTYMRGEIYEEKGFLSTETLTHSFTTLSKLSYAFRSRNKDQITCTIEQVEDNSCPPYFSQEVVVSNIKLKIMREYKGLVESASEIGGMIDLVFLVFYSVYGFYHHRVFSQKLIKSIYGLDAPAKNWCGCCKKRRAVTHLDSLDEDAQRLKARQLYEKAKASIERDMDLVEISKEINHLRLISSILLTEDIKSKVPLYILESTIKTPATASVNPAKADFNHSSRRSYPIVFPTALELQTAQKKRSPIKHRRLDLGLQITPDKDTDPEKKIDSFELRKIDLQDFEQKAAKALAGHKSKQKLILDFQFDKERSPYLTPAEKEPKDFEKSSMNPILGGDPLKNKVIKVGKKVTKK